eukprot:GDKJ01027008.1.p1 GENE.GDKJ01027008.1~~GDKJ01027008.1.p1  ORF type:complete len:113 (+),score=7.04 GDKJ01027008.1:18-356(+)
MPRRSFLPNLLLETTGAEMTDASWTIVTIDEEGSETVQILADDRHPARGVAVVTSETIGGMLRTHLQSLLSDLRLVPHHQRAQPAQAPQLAQASPLPLLRRELLLSNAHRSF